MTRQWTLKPVEAEYVIYFKEPLDEFGEITGMVIGADRAEIKDEHFILYKGNSVIFFCPIERIDIFYVGTV